MILNASHIVSSSQVPYVHSAPLRFPAGYVPSNPHDVATKSFAEQHVEQTNMIYMSKAGCAAGRTADGRTLETAFDNLGDALVAAGALQQELQGESGLSPFSTNVVVYCADALSIELSADVSIPFAVSIYAPNATFVSMEQRTVSFAYGSNGIIAHAFYGVKFLMHGNLSGMLPRPEVNVSAVLCDGCAIEFPENLASARFVTQHWRSTETEINVAARCTLIFVCTVCETNVTLTDTAINSSVQLWCDSLGFVESNWTVNAGTLELHNTVPINGSNIDITSPGKVYFYGPLTRITKGDLATYYHPVSQTDIVDCVNPESLLEVFAVDIPIRYTRDSESVSVYVSGMTVIIPNYANPPTPPPFLLLRYSFGSIPDAFPLPEGCSAKTIAVNHSGNTVVLLDVTVEVVDDLKIITIKKSGGEAFNNETLTISPATITVIF